MEPLDGEDIDVAELGDLEDWDELESVCEVTVQARDPFAWLALLEERDARSDYPGC